VGGIALDSCGATIFHRYQDATSIWTIVWTGGVDDRLHASDYKATLGQVDGLAIRADSEGLSNYTDNRTARLDPEQATLLG
jgi:hypothetical protein